MNRYCRSEKLLFAVWSQVGLHEFFDVEPSERLPVARRQLWCGCCCVDDSWVNDLVGLAVHLDGRLTGGEHVA